MSKRKLTIEEIHKLETALIDVTHKICKEHNIKYDISALYVGDNGIGGKQNGCSATQTHP